MKKTIAILFAILLVAAISFYGWNLNGGKRLSETDKEGRTKGEPAIQTLKEEGSDPVSLPALFEKELSGNGLALERILADNSSYTRHYITYDSGGLKISGIMNIPKGNPPAGGFPVLILNHGYIDPEIYTNGRGLRREQDFLAKNGYAVLHPDYRNHAESDKDAQADVKFRLGYVEDAINAILAVKNSRLANLDKGKIGMLGHSMGGGVTLNAMVAKPELVQAGVLFAPVSSEMADNFERWLSRRPELAKQIIDSYGSPEQNPEFWKNVSAASFFDRLQAPVLIHHGDADKDVPIEWSQSLKAKLDEERRQATFYTYPGQPHEFTSDWNLVMERTLSFFNQHLKQP